MAGTLGSLMTCTARRAATTAAVLAIFCPVHTNAQETAKPAHKMVRIGAFEIDQYEVTVGQFGAFWKATQIATKAQRDGGGFQYLGGWRRMAGWTWNAPVGDLLGRHDTPVVHVTWHEAKAYCEWMGLRLPTDAEWVEAAYTERRPAPPAPFVTGRTYPYPSGEDAAQANQVESSGKCHFSPPITVETRNGQRLGPVSVGNCAPGANGLYDMGGNVWEWVDHDVGGQKRTRGGSWWYGAAQMKADALYEKDPDFPAVYIGFRCAR